MLSAASLDARNTLDDPAGNVVATATDTDPGKADEITFKGESVTICEFALSGR